MNSSQVLTILCWMLKCDSNHYGENCARACNCGIGASRCDSVIGCICKSGWINNTCDVDKDECDSFPCDGVNEQCTNTPGSYSCDCLTGYSKNQKGICEDVDECARSTLNDCAQICTNTDGSFRCSCNPGFQKQEEQCEDINECEGQNDCSQVCNNTVGSYRCSCTEGFKLDLSDRRTCIPEKQCTSDVCGNNTQCVSVNGVDTCKCITGYEFAAGTNKSCVDIKECDINPHPCYQNCTELEGGYECSCGEAGFELDSDRTTCISCSEWSFGINCSEECSCDRTNTKTCNSTNGTCTCKSGWTGTNCTTDIDECNDTSLFECPDNSVCKNTNGSYYCQCDDGYFKSSGGSCHECGQGTFVSDCGSNCTCHQNNTESCNKVNGTCTCKDGWESDNCTVNINECQKNTFSCPANSSCSDTQGSYVCVCEAGYIKTNETCLECNGFFYGNNCATKCPCNFDNTIRCDHVSGKCQCKEGWIGTYCLTDVNECGFVVNPCNESHKTERINNQGSYSCGCIEGFELHSNGTCVDKDECDQGTDDCLQKCVNTVGSYNCSCSPGYSGTENDCSECAEGTWGEQCASTCNCDGSNSGGCDPGNGCICKPGWKGDNCAEDINECLDDPNVCVENSYCNNTKGSYTCTCHVGYKTSIGDCQECSDNRYGIECGSTCDCVANNTMNPSQSCDHVNGTCYCSQYWTGSQCETNIDECSEGTHNCTKENEGCQNEIDGFTCLCLLGYTRDNVTKECIKGTTTIATTTELPDDISSVSIVLTLNITVTDNLNLTVNYERYKKELGSQLLLTYQMLLPGVNVKIIINSIRTGSLIVAYTPVTPKSAMSKMAVANAEIAGTRRAFTIFDSVGYTKEMIINNITVPVEGKGSENLICEIYQASNGQCGSDQICTIIDELPLCEFRKVEGHMKIFVTGTFFFIIFIYAVAVIDKSCSTKTNSFKIDKIIYCRRPDDDGGSSLFAGRIASRIRTGPPSGPLRYSDMPTYMDPDASTISSDFNPYQANWKTASMEGSEDDIGQGQQSTWDYILNNVPPGGEYHIRRPMVDTEPQSFHMQNHPKRHFRVT